MQKVVIERDDDGNEIAVAYRMTSDERRERLQARKLQEQVGEQVRAAIRESIRNGSQRTGR